ncbi:hypothetical protein EVB68_031 [Rhizobium phage RHph_Y2_6]|uniref:Uncharacterized protein n=1 Tax=Rhizobium phage RHph_Y2_6 TaxID=2509576 RepID=A0A7S5UV48_9CAUD|nr:hypothetical protein PP748_gp031 [Rhizobium phage RHph_Y2_6]QIG68768.1 hypothetical protein EVB68_031 [Rhizobium phage RHph_Y2_6]
MVTGEFNIDDFISETLQDPQVEDVEHNESGRFIAIDFGQLEEAVLVHYIINERGTATLTKILMMEQEFTLDRILDSAVSSAKPEKDALSIRNIYGDPNSTFYVTIPDNDHNRLGDYRYDYRRNQHPRSPRKR